MVTRVSVDEKYWSAVSAVLDPEVPVLSVVDLGIVRDIREDEGVVVVDITPTYSGCPAMRVIEDDIRSALERAGAPAVRINTIFQPAWTTDWIRPDARERLREYGIAPPTGAATVGVELVPLMRRESTVPCPRCASPNTQLRSEFGATACKSIHYCAACLEPFEHFKPI